MLIRMSKGFIFTLVIIAIFVGGIVFLTSGPSKKSFDILSVDCGSFFLTLREDARLNWFEGNAASYQLLYTTPRATKSILEVSPSMMSGSVVPPPVNTRIPIKVFERPVKVPSQSHVAVITIYLDPHTYSRSEFDQIGTCIEKKRAEIEMSYTNNPNRYGSVKYLRFSAVAYVNESDLKAYIHSRNVVPSFSESSGTNNPDDLFVEDNGAVTSRKRGYLGSVFDVIIPGASSEILLSETATNSQGQTLPSFLEQLGEQLKNYDGTSAT